MIKQLTVAISIMIFVAMLASCSWVKLSKEGETVMVKSVDQVSQCKKVAKTTASLRDKVMGIERSGEKVQTELETLARNKAVEFGGNVVVPSSEIVDGIQSFDVYQCP